MSCSKASLRRLPTTAAATQGATLLPSRRTARRSGAVRRGTSHVSATPLEEASARHSVLRSSHRGAQRSGAAAPQQGAAAQRRAARRYVVRRLHLPSRWVFTAPHLGAAACLTTAPRLLAAPLPCLHSSTPSSGVAWGVHSAALVKEHIAPLELRSGHLALGRRCTGGSSSTRSESNGTNNAIRCGAEA